MHKLILIFLACSLSLILSTGAAASNGTISGVVTERTTGNPVSGVTVELLPEGDTTITSDAGTFRFSNVAPGPHMLRVGRRGFETMLLADVTISTKGGSIEQDVVLTRADQDDINFREMKAFNPGLPAPVAREEIEDLEASPKSDRAGDVASNAIDNSYVPHVYTRQELAKKRRARPVGQGQVSPGYIEPDEFMPAPVWPKDMFFRDYGTNRFVPTRRDPLSTFAADVDDGSFSISQRYLQQGHLPPTDAIRIEEFVNHFDFDYDSPRRTKFAVTSEITESPFNDSTHVLMIGIKGRDIDRAERQPVNLTFVIDVSGSMGYDNRMQIVKYALTELLDQLGPEDRVGIVSYGSGARVVLQPSSPVDAPRIQRAIQSLRPGGSTNAEAGLRLGYRMAERQYVTGHTNRIILCSDGVANVGLTSPEALAEEIQQRAHRGITLSSIGVGMGNYNDVLLEQLAKHGNGRYAYVNDYRQAYEEMVVKFTGNMELLARDVKIQVEFNPSVVSSYRLIGYENRDVADNRFRDNYQDGGEIGAGHEVTALYELVINRRPRGGNIGSVSVRWKDREGAEVSEMTSRLPYALRSIRRGYTDNLRLALTASTIAEILKDTRYVRNVTWSDLRRFAAPLQERAHDEQIQELFNMIQTAERLSAYHSRRW